LVWFLNHPSTIAFKARQSEPPSLLFKTVLEELEISIPDIEAQKSILKITELHNAEKN
jgi:hypothetical protein